MLKRRAVWNSRSRKCPKEISASGFSKMGSLTVRMADSNSSTRVPGGHPARLDVQLRHPPVVAVEKGQQILGEISLVLGGQGPDDAEVHRDVAPARLHEDIAGVHVGVEEVVAKDLGEEDLHPAFPQQAHAHPLGLEGTRRC